VHAIQAKVFSEKSVTLITCLKTQATKTTTTTPPTENYATNKEKHFKCK
jgi:hypothetical protein